MSICTTVLQCLQELTLRGQTPVLINQRFYDSILLLFNFILLFVIAICLLILIWLNRNNNNIVTRNRNLLEEEDPIIQNFDPEGPI